MWRKDGSLRRGPVSRFIARTASVSHAPSGAAAGAVKWGCHGFSVFTWNGSVPRMGITCYFATDPLRFGGAPSFCLFLM